jgi:hypothetical protein
MNGTQTYVIELSRVNSVGSISGQTSDDDKSSWTNKISPLVLKQGDSVNLQQVLLNIPGADTNAIQFQGVSTTPTSNLQDNFSLIEIGYYISHNGEYSCGLPLMYVARTPSTPKHLRTDNNKTLTDLINNSYGQFNDFAYWNGDDTDNSIADADRIAGMTSIFSCNPHFNINSKKFAIISPDYTGFARPDTNGSHGRGIEPMLLTKAIPVLIDAGFSSPSAIADVITNTLNQTNPLYSEDIYQPFANKIKASDTAPEKFKMRQYNLNGYCYKTTKCNLFKENVNQHHIYSNMAVDNPNQWKYGLNIVSNCETTNMIGDVFINTTLTNYANLEVNYPVLLWSRFIGTDSTVLDVGVQYDNYSPHSGTLIDGGADVVEVSGSAGDLARFNGLYQLMELDDNTGAYVYKSSNSYKVVTTEFIGEHLTVKPGLFFNNDEEDNTKVIAYNRLFSIGGTWYDADNNAYIVNDIWTNNQITPADNKFYSYRQLDGTTIYLGWNTETEYDDWNDEIIMGQCFSHIGDRFELHNRNTWHLNIGADFCTLQIQDAGGNPFLTLQAPTSLVQQPGWHIFQCNKVLEIENDTDFDEVVNEFFLTKYTDSIDNGRQSLFTNFFEGVEYDVNGNEVLFTNHLDGAVLNEKSYLPKHQLLMTNIEFTLDNVKMIELFFRRNEVYTGDFETRTEIAADLEHYYVEFDLGRADDNTIDVNSESDTDNQTGQSPLEPYYMWDTGTIGSGDAKDEGCICPRLNTGNHEQRLKVFTRWEDNYETRFVAKNMLDFPYSYGNTLKSADFKSNYSDLFIYISTNNVGIIPYLNKQGNLMIAFETYEDYTNGELYRIQNFTYFIYSPSVCDHDYVALFNNDAPAVTEDEPENYSYSANITDQMNYLNVGACKPAMTFNTELNKFGFSYFHMPTYFNQDTGTIDNIGSEIARVFDSTDRMVFKDFVVGSTRYQDQSQRNIGINDSQSGIFINDLYLKKMGSKFITSTTDPSAVKLTSSNYYNCLWWKLGFSFYDLQPIRFAFNSFHDNRFNAVSYNNVNLNGHRESSISPFTTNSLISINDMPAINLFSENSGTKATKNTNFGTPIFGLGFNNNQTAAVQTSSAIMYARSIPVNISSGYYRVYTDMPIDTLNYSGGNSTLNCIGYALLNYSSSSQFFYSYAMDFGATITKDVNISSIKVEIRDEQGNIIRGMGDRSNVVLKVQRAIQIGISDPQADQSQPDISGGAHISEDEKEEKKMTRDKNMDRVFAMAYESLIEHLIHNTKIRNPSDRHQAIDEMARSIGVFFSSKAGQMLNMYKKAMAHGFSSVRTELQKLLKEVPIGVNHEGHKVNMRNPVYTSTAVGFALSKAVRNALLDGRTNTQQIVRIVEPILHNLVVKQEIKVVGPPKRAAKLAIKHEGGGGGGGGGSK